ncbi:MAG: DEAD/DEAH box helicase [Opitutales bacterium]|nr:DEAD/DEAH box helicase [Opitutales bacterium]
MQRTAKRVYSPKALESWLDRLKAGWESSFNPHELELGRQLYREGDIREIEIDHNVIIAHMKQGKELIYSVVEWSHMQPEVRSSIENMEQGRALAIAGLYETEELFADEIDAWSVETPGEGRPSAIPSPPITSTKKAGETFGKARELLIKLSAHYQGIKADAFWKDESGTVPALEGKAQSLKHPLERERMIRLTSLLKKANFVYRQDKRFYILREITAIPTFLRELLPKWKESFLVDTEASLQKLRRGVQDVRVEIKVESSYNGLQMHWNISAEGAPLPEDLALKLLRRNGQPMLFPDFGLLRIPRELVRKIADLEALRNGEAIPHYMLFSLFGQEGLHIDFTPELQWWKEDLLQATEPEARDTHLRGYQQRGVHWMKHLFAHDCHGLLGDEMGLGKTMQVLDLLHSSGLKRTEPRSHLIVCPASVVPVWIAEAERFYPSLKLKVLHKKETFEAGAEPVIWVASYTQLRRHKKQLETMEFGFAVLDEAQMIKNPDAKSTQACLAIKAQHRLAVTGTPLENKELDLWTLFRFLMPGLLGTRGNLETMLQVNRMEVIQQLKAQIAPFILRRSKHEVAKELPPKQEMVLRCPLTPLQRKLYNRVATEGKIGIKEGHERMSAMSLLAILTRLRQVCCDPGLLPWVKEKTKPEDSGKLQVLQSKLDEVISAGGKAVVFSQFVSLLNRVEHSLQESFPNLPRYKLTGGTKDRSKPVKAFQGEKGSAVMLVSLKAGGTGITLHAADYVFLLDPWWKPAVENQAIDRVHRIGQEKKVFVYRLITEGTVEERVELLKEGKAALFQATVGMLGDNSLVENHSQSLKELFDLIEIADGNEN